MTASKIEFHQIPEVDFRVSSTGITIICSRFNTPRFVEFDIRGKCDTCRSDSAEIDFLITIEGITIYCTRMRQPIFMPFDYKYTTLPEYCLFRVKTRGKSFNIEHPHRAQTIQSRDILSDAVNLVPSEPTKNDAFLKISDQFSNGNLKNEEIV